MLARKVYVGEFEQKIIETIPKGFYTGRNKYSLISSFDFLQQVAYFGRDIMLANLGMTKTLVLLCLDSINTRTANQQPRQEADQCEGVLTLQSILLSCGAALDGDVWQMLAKNLTERICSSGAIYYDFYKSSLLNVVGLVFLYGHRHFS